MVLSLKVKGTCVWQWSSEALSVPRSAHAHIVRGEMVIFTVAAVVRRVLADVH